MLLTCYLETGQSGLARVIISDLEAANALLDVSVYESFIATIAFGEEGDRAVEEILKMVDHMKKRGLEPGPSTYKQLFNNLINLRQQDKAFQLLVTLCDSKTTPLSAELFSPLVRAYCSNEDVTKALQVVELMQKMGVLPNEFLATALVFCLVRQQQFQKAWDIVSWAKGSGVDSYGFEDIIHTAEKKVTS